MGKAADDGCVNRPVWPVALIVPMRDNKPRRAAGSAFESLVAAARDPRIQSRDPRDTAVYHPTTCTQAIVSPHRPRSRCQAKRGRPRKPWATATLWILTAAAATAQLLHPILLDQFRRSPEALTAGQWWRMITPMFFQDGHLTGTVFNLVILAVIGAHAEALLGPWRWLIIYFGAGLFGNAVSYAWLNPTGAGNSMAVAGLLGTLAAALLVAGRRYDIGIPSRLRVVALAWPMLAIADTLLHDNHGLPLLLGMGPGLLLLPRYRIATHAAPSTDPATIEDQF